MPEISRTIVVLDQASGTLRVDDDAAWIGIDLNPAVSHWLQEQAGRGPETVIVVPNAPDGGAAAALADVDVDRMGQLARAAGVTQVRSGTGALGDLPGPAAATTPPHGADDTRTAFVCADRAVRGRARGLGYLPVPHAAVLPLLSADGPVAVRLAGRREALERLAARHGLVPMHFQPIEHTAEWALIGLCPTAAVVDAAVRGLWVMPLAVDPATEDLVWVRLEAARDAAREQLAGRRIVFAEPNQMLLALGPEESSEELGLHGAHGHTEFLAPDPGLLQPARVDADVRLADVALAGPSAVLEPVDADPAARRHTETFWPRCSTVTRGYTRRLDRYTGETSLDAAGPVVSRHIAHPDNKRVEAQLLADLTAMGYHPWRHDFLHNGVTHSNVIADLPGTGHFRIRPQVLERLRQVIAPQTSRDELLGELRSLDVDVSSDGTSIADLPEPALRRELERVLGLQPWSPWWRTTPAAGGLGAGLVIVGGHLDSTAAFEPDYSPATHPAPGRDDNGSGLAGVLTLAQHFRALAGRLTHTVRFCFFNAEEAGLVGSKAYAAHLKALDAPVRAVYCTDMMGYNSDDQRIFELHAGYTDPAVRDLSVPLALRIADAAAQTASLPPAQVYRGTGYDGAPDRTVFDGAINRSDHAAFQQQGWGAVLATEDFFANLPSEPVPDANPNYHRAGDQIVDTAYARAITCAVGRAVALSAL